MSSVDLSPTASSPHGITPDAFLRSARRVIETEYNAIGELADCLDAAFASACERLLACSGHIVVTGMGKSGHVARKIAATLASTGSPAFFVHPGEASHGDLGMIRGQDIVLALSNSGETDELLLILPSIKRQGSTLIAITGHRHSSLAQQADIHIDIGTPLEACPLGLAPTSSTTVSLVLGDALAIALLEARGFTSTDFARSHPAGTLGRRLLLRISDIMHAGAAIPRVPDTATVGQAVVETTEKHLGLTAVIGRDGRLVGVFTDGDLRRSIEDNRVDLRHSLVRDAMTRHPKTIHPDQLAVEAAHLMEQHKIHALLVTDADRRVVGALNIHDLLRARVV